MTTIAHQQLSRTLLAGALAIAGTLASFSATTTPAHAQGAAQRGYTATLTTALDAPARKVVNGVQWNCTGDQCAGPIDGSAPINTCTRVAKAFGAVTRFTTPKGELSADKLERCNAAA